jgi:membrane associated rhomboid family serine protease
MTPAPVGLRCPEHSGKPQGVQRVTRPAQRAVSGVGARRMNAVTMALVGINVLVYLAELAAGGGVNGTNNWIYDHGALFASGAYVPGGVVTAGPHVVVPFGIHLVGVAHGEWWRLITAAFLHYGPIHLAMNMYGLYLAGTLLEHVIGRWRFLLLYLAAGIFGSAGALLVTPNAATAGASGAIFGIFGALFLLERRGHIATRNQIAGLIVLNLVFTFAVPGISVGGHVGGLIAGVALMWLMLEFRRSAVYSAAAAAGFIVLGVVIAYYRTRGYT